MDYITVGSTGVQVSPLCLGNVVRRRGRRAGLGTDVRPGPRGGDQLLRHGRRLRRRRVGGEPWQAHRRLPGRGRHRLEGLLSDQAGHERPRPVAAAHRPRGRGEPEAAGHGVDRLLLRAAFDERTPIEQTLRALDDLRRQRKILYPAISNWAAWQIATALGISAKEGLARFELEPMYNLVKRQAEVEILPLAAAENLVSSPTARSAPACSPASTPAAHARRAGGWSTTPATAWTATSPPQTGSRPSRRRSASSPRPSPWPGRCRTRPSPRRSSARATRTAGGLTRRSGRRDDR
jgi:Aldo/keto reductase family